MNISLTPELERLIDKKVESGLYQTASEVIREALRVLKDRDEQFERLRADVLEGFAEFDRGAYLEFDGSSSKRLVREVRSRGRRALSQARPTRRG